MDLSGTHDLSRQTGRARAHEGGEWPRQEPFAKPPVAADPQHPNGFPPGKNVRMALIAALGFAQLPSQAPELQLLHRWLDTWSGLGDIAVGMARQGYRLSLSHIGPREWWAVFATPPSVDSSRLWGDSDAVDGGAAADVGGGPPAGRAGRCLVRVAGGWLRRESAPSLKQRAAIEMRQCCHHHAGHDRD